jgi:hypothetical protein
MASVIPTPEASAQESASARSSGKTTTNKRRAAKKSKSKKSPITTGPNKKAVMAKKAVTKKSTAKKAAPKKRKAKKQPTANKINKSQAIRDAAKELGTKARPRHIIAALAEKGINVVSAQVSTVLKAAGLRRGRRRKRIQALLSRKPSANGNLLIVDDLVKVKKLADDLGGTAKLKQLASALERLL